MDVSTLCRSCTKSVASWEKGNFDQTTIEMFTYCTLIKISEDDKLPKQFCYDCFIKIESSYTFIKEAQKVNITLRNMVSRDQNSVIVETDSLLKRFTPEYQPKSVLSLPDYEITNFPQFKEFLFTDQEEQIRSEVVIEQEFNKTDTQREDILNDNINNECENETKEENNKDTSKDLHLEKPKVENKVEKVKNYHCPVCRKGFTFKSWMDKHLAKEHTAGVKYDCKECDKSFSTPHQLSEHARAHGSRAFACACGARFRRRQQLRAHAKRHSDERPYACDICPRRFKTKSVLKGHIKLHSSEKPYLCSVCGLRFAHAGNLKAHAQTHSPRRVHACASCAFRSASAASLRRHAARHDAPPKHQCQHCAKAFYDASGLARHTRTHTGALPYRCARCGRCFADSWKRKTHLMRRHQMALHDIPRMTRDGRVI